MAGTGIKTSEYFWLCRRCAGRMTLRLDDEKGIKVVELRDTTLRGNDSMDFVLLDRQNGLLLSGINFTVHRTRKRAFAGEGARIRI